MSKDKTKDKSNFSLFFGLLTYLGGAFFVGNQAGMDFWDGLIWMWYIGRYIAAHFAMLHY